jgi:hypothetical protein
VIERIKCKKCGKQGIFTPTDPRFPLISDTSLARLWKSFADYGIDLTEYPQLPKYYFSRDPKSIRISNLEEARESLRLSELKEIERDIRGSVAKGLPY